MTDAKIHCLIADRGKALPCGNEIVIDKVCRFDSRVSCLGISGDMIPFQKTIDGVIMRPNVPVGAVAAHTLIAQIDAEIAIIGLRVD